MHIRNRSKTVQPFTNSRELGLRLKIGRGRRRPLAGALRSG
ncbi:hypothetical protein CI41S_53190 [Bradyrhizobium ivorense]|nr:hypothetical protein CI41S_53190 [Bradyrhizobium ivorense]